MTIQPYEPPPAPIESEPGQELVSWARALSSAHQIAKALCVTAFVPKHFSNKPDEAAAALMLGSELGLSPVSALKSIFVVSGTPGLYARSMVALTLAHGHEVWTEKSTDEEVVVCGRRKGNDHVERVSWTNARARKAKYTSNSKYETDPQSMLYARAAADVCRRVAPDTLSGLAVTVEELELEGTPQATRKVQRRKAELPAMPEPDPIPTPDAPGPQEGTQEPGEPITSAQSKKLHASFGDIGIEDHAARLAYARNVVGREDIESSNELTKAEASQVIDAIGDVPAEPELPEPEGWEPK